MCAQDCAFSGAKCCAHDCASSGATFGAEDCASLQYHDLLLAVLKFGKFCARDCDFYGAKVCAYDCGLFLVLKVAIDFIHWAFKPWCSFLPV